jgi:acyl-CoA dehydrogenase
LPFFFFAKQRIFGNQNKEVKMPLDFFLQEEHQQLNKGLSTFVAGLGPLIEKEDHEVEASFRAYVKALAEGSLLRYAASENAKKPLSLRSACLIRETLGYASPLADLAFVMQGLGTFAAIHYGSEALSEDVSKKARSGHFICAFALTEPNAGSDVANIQSRAVRVDGGYLLNGEKIFISNAPIADGFTLFVSTNPEAGGKGLSAFWVEKNTPGLSVEAIDLISPHPIGRVIYQDMFVPESSRIGAEGDGMKLALGTLDFFRTSVGAAAIGMAQRALDESIAYAKKRIQFKKPISEQQSIQAKLAQMATKIEASRLLVYRAAYEKDRGAARIGKEAAMAKLFATESAFSVIDDAVQIHGGYGLIKNSITEKLYREIRALRIYEGTTEIQYIVIASHLLK